MDLRPLLLACLALPALASQARAVVVVHGATVPWVTYEAEQAATTGSVVGPDYTGQTPAREASGRQCVLLNATGQYVQFTANADAQGLIVRYCIPDSSDGTGLTATLALYINGQFSQKLSMTSQYAYLYGAYPFTNTPSDGTPRHFWDELRIMPTIHAGDTIRLEKDADDSAAQYYIDLIDLETVPAALTEPAGAVSVTNYGATPNDATDDRPAFLSAISAAQKGNKIVWIPPGQYVIQGEIDLSNVTLTGAGMWYSTLIGATSYTPGNRVYINGAGSNVTLSNFAIIGKLNYRNDSEANDGLGGYFGTGSVIRNVWVEHTKTGAWITNSSGLLIDSCRFRNTIADGCNLCLGMQNTTVQNCTARGGGDDCFAMWPATYSSSTYSAGGNRFVSCTAQLPFLAQGFSVYGGNSNQVYNCLAVDIPYGAGLFASTTFATVSGFSGTTSYSQNQLTRVGDADGAIGVVANLVNLAGLQFDTIQINDCPYDGVRFESVNNHVISATSFNNIQIINTGLSGSGYGVIAANSAVGSATFSTVNITNAKSGAYKSGSSFQFIQTTPVGPNPNVPTRTPVAPKPPSMLPNQ